MSDKKDPSRRELLRGGVAVGTGLVLAQAAGGRVAMAGAKTPKVPRRVLGKTGRKIPILLFGAAVDMDPMFDPKLAEAVRYGVDYIDAAAIYLGGRCEPAVGSFMKKANNRKDLWITSKSKFHDPAGYERSLESSLRKLKTDHIDLYFLHALKDSSFLSKDLQKTVERLKKAGKIKHFGFSCHHGNVDELLQVAAKTPWVDSVMFRYNFRNYGQKELNRAIDACAKANVGLIAMKTQGSAVSFDKEVKKFRKTGKWTKHQAVLKAVWADERISAAVSAMDSLKKLHENIAAALDRSKLTMSEMSELERYAQVTRRYACDGCDHLCGGAMKEEVAIGDTMRYLMYHDVYGEPDKARQLFAKLPSTARRLKGIDFSAAANACPHGVDIDWHMKRATEILA